jgi:hypothetical protein
MPVNEIAVSGMALLPAAKALGGGIPGSVTDTREMLAFAARHGIRAEVETFPIADVQAALDRVRDGEPPLPRSARDAARPTADLDRLEPLRGAGIPDSRTTVQSIAW